MYGIFTYIYHKDQLTNVGKYTSPMDPNGILPTYSISIHFRFSMTPSDGSSTLLAGYISLKELDENASKVLLGFRRWAIAECRGRRFFKKVDGGGHGGKGLSIGIR